MTLDLTPLLPTQPPHPNRLLIEATLKPVQGRRFQPTGFPDLGAALFDGGQRLLVESAQSMANRMEMVCWDESKKELVPELKGLSYVRVESGGEYLTSSITEAHRLNSPFILEGKDKTFAERLTAESAELAQGIIDRPGLASLILRYDTGSLLHGVFLAKKELAGGRLRLERALSAFIEASGVEVAASGGVKLDHLDASGKEDKGVGGASSEGFGNVPFQRDEYTASEIVAYFNLDLAQIRGYGLDAATEQMLVALGLYKILSLLDGNLRLRTACDLELDGSVRVTRPEGYTLPSLGTLRGELPKLVKASAKHFAGDRGITTVNYVKKTK